MFAVALLLAGSVPPAGAQVPPPRVALLAGTGNTFGGVGLTGEYLLSGTPLSLVAGGGYVPADSPFDDTWGVAAGIRLYSSASRHAAFAEAALLPLVMIRQSTEQHTHYGPSLSAGYRYLAHHGFTAMIGGGAGWTSAHGVDPVINLGLGFTWRSSRD
jgi:hypothetical protein